MCFISVACLLLSVFAVRCGMVLLCRVHEANQLKAELTVARMAERAAREKYQDFMRTSSMYGVSVGPSVRSRVS